MSTTLDITPLRSFVAIAAAGGFHRAAATLHLTQSAVSQHVRRLETATGSTLIERVGRQASFTAEGEQLLREARKILGVHDTAARLFEQPQARTISIGATEHAAEMMLPEVAAAMRQLAPDLEIRFRMDRTHHVLTALEAGAIDLGIVIEVAEPDVADQSVLALHWYAARTWARPEHGPLPVIAFDAPCMLRTPLFDLLDEAGTPYQVVAEAADLAGYHAAARAGLGVGLLPTLGRAPDGLAELPDLPPPPAVRMTVRHAPTTPAPVRRIVSRAVKKAMRQR